MITPITDDYVKTKADNGISRLKNLISLQTDKLKTLKKLARLGDDIYRAGSLANEIQDRNNSIMREIQCLQAIQEIGGRHDVL